MIERLIGPNRWGNTGWKGFNHLKEYGGTFSEIWVEGPYVFIAWKNESAIDVFRQPYLQGI